MDFAHEFLGGSNSLVVVLRDGFLPGFGDPSAIGHLVEPNAHEVTASDDGARKIGDPGRGIERYEYVQSSDRIKPSCPLCRGRNTC